MKVFVVTEPSWDYTELHGVYKTVEGAKEAFPDHEWEYPTEGNTEYHYSEGLFINEYDLND